MTTSTDVNRRIRPNPFAFASDTTFRFALLITGVAGATPSVWEKIWTATHFPDVKRTLTTCLERFPLALPLNPESAYFDLEHRREAVGTCFQSISHRGALAGLTGLAGVFLLTVILYWIAPMWRIRRRNLIPLPIEVLPGMSGELERLQQDAGIHKSVRFLVDPVNPRVGALAFGSVARRYVLLNRGLIDCFEKDPAAFRAILRHELAHVRNRDIDVAYLTMFIWWAFFLLAIVPLFVILTLQAIHFHDFSLVFRAGWRAALLTIVVLLIRNSTLRARESYADVRASIWDGPTGALKRVLHDDGSRRRRSGSWPSFFRVHPPSALRRVALDDPRPLLTIGFWEALAASVVVSHAFESTATALGQVFWDRIDYWLAAWMLGPFLADVVALGVWRAAYADYLTGGDASLRSNLVGVGLGLGLAVGRLTTLPAGLINEMNMLGMAVPVSVRLIGIATVMLGSWLFVRWFAAAASAWMPALTNRSSPLLITIAALVVAALVLAELLPTVLWLQTYLNDIGYHPVAGLVAFLTPIFGTGMRGPVRAMSSLVFFTLLWAYPLAGARWPTQHGSHPAWLTLDGPAALKPHTDSTCTRTKSAALLGLAMAMLLLLAILVLWLRVGQQVPLDQRQNPEWRGKFHGSIWGLTALLAMVAGVVATVRAPVLRLAHGLLAASVTGTIGAVMSCAILIVDGCGVSEFGLSSASIICSRSDMAAIVGDGVPLVFRLSGYTALVGILLTAGIINFLHWLRRRRASPDLDLSE